MPGLKVGGRYENKDRYFQAVTFRVFPAICAYDGVAPLVEVEPPDSNCCKSCCRVANAVCALERLLDCSAADSEFNACKISLLCWPPPW